MKRSAGFLLVLLLFSSILNAGKAQITAVPNKSNDITGRELLNKINSREQADNTWALGYIAGIYCVHANINVPDLAIQEKYRAVVKKYLEKNKSKLNQSAGDLVIEALERSKITKNPTDLRSQKIQR